MGKKARKKAPVNGNHDRDRGRRSMPVSAPARFGRRHAIMAGAGSIALVTWMVFEGAREQPNTRESPSSAHSAEYVGSGACLSCHRAEYEEWSGSHHARAMQVATDQTVLGDFGETQFSSGGVTSTFFRSGDRFMVRTDDADGELADFEVRYTFGVEPLQQYLIERQDGRLQPLQIAWNSLPREEGGQAWFHLYSGDVPRHVDPLHWTGAAQNWNFMCADCHSTNVRRGYDATEDRFATRWSEINVGCEACHGPGSNHLEWVRAGGRGDENGAAGLTAVLKARRDWEWVRVPGAMTATRTGAAGSVEAELQVCAQCHSRRVQVAEGYTPGEPLHDFYLPELLAPGVYHADGQQFDEVYTYGSFLQSRMYASGVTCSDCHNPHSQALRADGNQLCAQCHAPERFDVPEHHFHPESSPGAQCVSCHMPATTYMRVDDRRDHSFRVPRPDRSVTLGVPNACSGCHSDRSAEWAAAAVEDWYGGPATSFQSFAEAFSAFERVAPEGDSTLALVAGDPRQAAWVRASALARLADRPSPAGVRAALAEIRHPDPLVRRSALRIGDALPPAQRTALAVTLLDDSIRIVRMQAAWVLAPAAGHLSSSQRSRFDRAADEFIDLHRRMADRSESRVTLGTFLVLLERYAEAETEFLAAIRLSHREAPAYVNLADLLRILGREGEARQVLRQGLALSPDDPTLHYSLGLALVRTGEYDAALRELRLAAEQGPDQPRFAYAYAVALNSAGFGSEAVAALRAAVEAHPRDRELFVALVTFLRDAGDLALARSYAGRLVELDPGDARSTALLQSLEGPTR